MQAFGRAWPSAGSRGIDGIPAGNRGNAHTAGLEVAAEPGRARGPARLSRPREPRPRWSRGARPSLAEDPGKRNWSRSNAGDVAASECENGREPVFPSGAVSRKQGSAQGRPSRGRAKRTRGPARPSRPKEPRPRWPRGARPSLAEDLGERNLSRSNAGDDRLGRTAARQRDAQTMWPRANARTATSFAPCPAEGGRASSATPGAMRPASECENGREPAFPSGAMGRKQGSTQGRPSRGERSEHAARRGRPGRGNRGRDGRAERGRAWRKIPGSGTGRGRMQAMIARDGSPRGRVPQEPPRRRPEAAWQRAAPSAGRSGPLGAEVTGRTWRRECRGDGPCRRGSR